MPDGSFELDIENVTRKRLADGMSVCGNGHMAVEFGYCEQKGCPYSRGYRKPKAKR
jgi:hypothetical protein